MKKQILIIMFLLSLPIAASGQVHTKQEEQAAGALVEILFKMEFNSTSEANAFFDVYKEQFEGVKNHFKDTPSILAGTKAYLSESYRAGIWVGFFSSRLRDGYYVENNGSNRTYSQELDISNIPVLAVFEYVPYRSQFRTYLSGGLGLDINQITWTESIRSSWQADPREGGLNYDESHITPMMSLATGLELGFDKFGKKSFLGALIFEVKYAYYFRKLDIFGKVKQQFQPEVPQALERKYAIAAGYLSFGIALSFNYYHIGLKK